MSNSSVSSIFLVQLVCFLVFLPISLCSNQVFITMDEKLIEETCRKTPDYDICLFCLKYIGGSEIYSANRSRLADVMLDVVGLKATTAQNKVKELLRQTQGDRSLETCSSQYAFIISTIVPIGKKITYTLPKATWKTIHAIPEMLRKGCGDAFRRSSDLVGLNLGVEKVAAIAEAIIGQLG